MEPVSREEALEIILNKWNINVKGEEVDLREAVNHVTTKDIYSINTLPVVRSSKADGIAVKSESFINGYPNTNEWILGIDYVRADTGDDFSDDFDTVIPIEEIAFNQTGGITILDKNVVKGSNINLSGSIVKKGQLLVKKGTCLRAVHLAILASGGIKSVEVIKKPKIVFIPTGNELIEAFIEPRRGQNIESNSLMLEALSKEYGADFICYPIVRDNMAELEKALDNALEEADIVLINGGSSKGDEDYNTKLLINRGILLQHYVTTAPGRPIGIAIENNIPIINVPGPTIGAFYAMDWCVSALINTYLGKPLKIREKIKVRLAEDVKTPAIFEFFLRLKVIKENGEYIGIPLLGDKGFPKIMGDANALFISPLGESSYKKDEILKVELLYGREAIE